MDKPTQLSSRQRQVLRATIRHYVSTAEPVGSKALVDGYDLKVSSATIRNVMGALERSGLLYQPHISAGRVPSDSGYRTYVDSLIQPSKPLARKVDKTLNCRLDWEGWSIEALFREATQILANLSGYVALVTLPTSEASTLRHLKLVSVEGNQILLVVLLDSHSTESVVLPFPQDLLADDLPEGVLDQELLILSNFLTEQLRGKPLSAMTDLNWDELDRAFHQYAEMLGQGVADLAERSSQAHQTQILISGLADALSQPEFSERHQIKNLVSLLEDGQETLWPLIFRGNVSQSKDISTQNLMVDKPLRIWIGSENPLVPMQTCALISAPYTRDTVPLGSVGVLGPTRMLYENAIAAVEAAASYLSGAISQVA